MTTWTFTTSDLREAAAISLLCVTQNLHGVTETKQDTPNAAPAKAKPARKAKPVEYWKNPEGVKVRKRTLAAIDTRMRGSRGQVINTRDRHLDPVHAYAEALGVTPEAAAEKIKAHNQHLADTPATYQW